MLFFYTLKNIFYIFISCLVIFLFSCTGSKKYFKAAEKLEKQGLVNEAASYYLESLERKKSNVDARLKLKQVGQKYVNNLSSEFFRNHSTNQIESSLESFEKLIDFTKKTNALEVTLDYPKAYEEDYKNDIEKYCETNYNQAYNLVSIKNYALARKNINNILKYNPTYKDIVNLDIISTCEPLYQSAISSIENKNYQSASNILTNIANKSIDYKDTKDLIELTKSSLSKNLLIFKPSNSNNKTEKDLEDYYFDQFSQASQQNKEINILNNTPFTKIQTVTDINNVGNIDLIQAIRKASNSDYFFIFNISDIKIVDPGAKKYSQKGYQEVRTKVNDTLVKTEFKEFYYNNVKQSRAINLTYNFKLINAYNNQILKTNTQLFSASDMIDFNEMSNTGKLNLNSLFPYNPSTTAQVNQYNPRAWRNSFSQNKNLKNLDELQSEINYKVIQSYNTNLSSIAK